MESKEFSSSFARVLDCDLAQADFTCPRFSVAVDLVDDELSIAIGIRSGCESKRGIVAFEDVVYSVSELCVMFAFDGEAKGFPRLLVPTFGIGRVLGLSFCARFGRGIGVAPELFECEGCTDSGEMQSDWITHLVAVRLLVPGYGTLGQCFELPGNLHMNDSKLIAFFIPMKSYPFLFAMLVLLKLLLFAIFVPDNAGTVAFSIGVLDGTLFVAFYMPEG